MKRRVPYYVPVVERYMKIIINHGENYHVESGKTMLPKARTWLKLLDEKDRQFLLSIFMSNDGDVLKTMQDTPNNDDIWVRLKRLEKNCAYYLDI